MAGRHSIRNVQLGNKETHFKKMAVDAVVAAKYSQLNVGECDLHASAHRLNFTFSVLDFKLLDTRCREQHLHTHVGVNNTHDVESFRNLFRCADNKSILAF